MFQKLFKNKSIGFYISLAASLLSLFLTIFYAVYMGEHGLFNAGVFILYLFAFLLPLVYFFVKENELTRIVPILQALLLSLAFGFTFSSVINLIIFWLTDTDSLINATATGDVLLFLLVMTAVTIVVSLIASFLRQTKKLSAEKQAEVDESWTSFKGNTKAFVVKHKTPLIIGSACVALIIAMLIVLCTVILPRVTVIHVKGVTLDHDSLVMYETDPAVQLIASVTPENAENSEVIFTSSNENVAKVYPNGYVEAVSPGNATITVKTMDGEYTAECPVEIKELTVKETTIVSLPNTIHYEAGETFDPSGLILEAELTNGKIETIDARRHNLTYSLTTVNNKKETVTATYEYRNKQFTATFDVYGDVKAIASADELANFDLADIGYLRYTGEGALVFDTKLDITSDLVIEADVKLTELTVAEGVTLEVTKTLWSDTSMTISGGGTLIATKYEKEDGTGDRKDHAAIRTNSDLTINGTTVKVANIVANNLTIDGGAQVTVLGKDVSGAGGAGQDANGIHLGGELRVSDEGTRLDVLFNSSTRQKNGAPIEAKKIIVDAATVNCDSAYSSSSWMYAAWFSGGEIRLSNGAQVKFVTKENPSANWGVFGNGCDLYVDETSRFETVYPTGRDLGNMVIKEGTEGVNIIWTTT